MVARILILFLIFSSPPLQSPGSAQQQGRIVGGNYARESQFPWQAAIVERTNYICNGFIINEFWIGTTAFCVDGRVGADLEAIVGTITWNAGGMRYRISEMKIHPGFVPSLHLNDVAALRTQQHIAFSDKIRQGTLGAVLVNPGATVTQSSFGKTSHLAESISDVLMFISLQVITKADCQARLSALGHDPGMVFDSNFCTFNRIGQGACHGNSGSPIVNANNQIVGFNTWDEFCGL